MANDKKKDTTTMQEVQKTKYYMKLMKFYGKYDWLLIAMPIMLCLLAFSAAICFISLIMKSCPECNDTLPIPEQKLSMDYELQQNL